MTLLLGQAEPLYVSFERDIWNIARLQHRRDQASDAAATAQDHMTVECLAGSAIALSNGAA
jgi:hypothetical protein